jgi:hypothetical protein
MTNQNDPIIEEIHETRREIARRFNLDVHKISEDAKRRQLREGRPVWQPQPSSQPAQSHTGAKTPAADNGACG